MFMNTLRLEEKHKAPQKFVTTTAIYGTSAQGHPQQLILLSREAGTCVGFPTPLEIPILPHIQE